MTTLDRLLEIGVRMQPINGYVNYWVTRTGDIFSQKSGKWLKRRTSGSVYPSVCLWRDGRSEYQRIHRIVASSFIPNPEGKPQVNHIDGDPTNNHVDNLEWCTPGENIAHSYELSGRSGYGAVRVKQTDLVTGQVVAIHNSIDAAGRSTGHSAEYVRQVIGRRKGIGGGYRWERLQND